jgi:hypothetical protein
VFATPDVRADERNVTTPFTTVHVGVGASGAGNKNVPRFFINDH